mgnify:CR=1 FL=1
MKTLQQIVDESRSIVFFGGAGGSTESGIDRKGVVEGKRRDLGGRRII